jgi:hypothetical protein
MNGIMSIVKWLGVALYAAVLVLRSRITISSAI